MGLNTNPNSAAKRNIKKSDCDEFMANKMVELIRVLNKSTVLNLPVLSTNDPKKSGPAIPETSQIPIIIPVIEGASPFP